MLLKKMAEALLYTGLQYEPKPGYLSPFRPGTKKEEKQYLTVSQGSWINRDGDCIARIADCKEYFVYTLPIKRGTKAALHIDVMNQF